MNVERLLILSLLGSLLLTILSLLFPGILALILSLVFGPQNVILLGLEVFAGYFVILLGVGLFFTKVPRLWGYAFAAVLILLAIIFLSPEAALVDVFGVGLAFLESDRARV